MPTLDIAALPSEPINPLVPVAVVVDVLRATTMVAALLDAGAAGVRPIATVEAARFHKSEHPEVILAGERDGLRPDGFDLGNSPLDVAAEHVRGREVVLTTTNGTAAIDRVREEASAVLTLSLTNLEAVAERLRRDAVDAVVVCSGTDRKRSVEDELAAGMLAERLFDWDLTDRASAVRDAALELLERSGSIEAAVAGSPHAGRLESLGFAQDVVFCSRVGSTDCVPVLDRARGLLVPG